jgi:hypothetical protein
MDDCVFNHERNCTALTRKKCKDCRFRKTREELLQGRAKASKRISTLPFSKQEHIRLKYYIRGKVRTEC